MPPPRIRTENQIRRYARISSGRRTTDVDSLRAFLDHAKNMYAGETPNVIPLEWSNADRLNARIEVEEKMRAILLDLFSPGSSADDMSKVLGIKPSHITSVTFQPNPAAKIIFDLVVALSRYTRGLQEALRETQTDILRVMELVGSGEVITPHANKLHTIHLWDLTRLPHSKRQRLRLFRFLGTRRPEQAHRERMQALSEQFAAHDLALDPQWQKQAQLRRDSE